MSTILIVDDDVYIGDMLEEILTKEGYRTARAYSGTEALMYLSSSRPDLILLDLMLPGLSGEELLPLIKDIPVIVVSAKAETSDKVGLLLGGACDYITKPFSLPVLYAKVMAMTERVRGTADADLIVRGNVTVNICTRRVSVRGTDCSLAPKEYEMLLLFLKDPNRTFTREQLLVRVWGYDFEGNERVVDNHIKKLRKTLEGSACRIHTVRNTGYRMEVSV